jgi:hypothetical protein
MEAIDTQHDYNALSPKDKATYDYVKKLNPEFTGEQLWKSFEARKQRLFIQELLKKPVSAPNASSYSDNGRTKTKDAIMKTIIYGGGFVAEGIASVALGMLCAAMHNPHAHQMWMGSRNARKEHKDKAWSAYCLNGDMMEGFSALVNLEN